MRYIGNVEIVSNVIDIVNMLLGILMIFPYNGISFSMAKMCHLSLKFVLARISDGTRPDPMSLCIYFLCSSIVISTMHASSSTSIVMLSYEFSSVSCWFPTSFLLRVFSKCKNVWNCKVLLDSSTFLSFFLWKVDFGSLSDGGNGFFDNQVINH